VKIWTQWNDLTLPAGMTHLATDAYLPSEDVLDQVEFYVPSYMRGVKTLDIIPRMKNLKVVHYSQAGYEDILGFVPENVILCNASGLHDVSTSELALGLTIASRADLPQILNNQHRQTWVHKRRVALADSHVGILGHGHIGKRIAGLIENFEAKVTSFSNSGRDGSIKVSEFDSYLPSLDVIILILPLTEQTHHFFNKKRLQAMKDGASLINMARGAIVDTNALIEELNTGRIHAALDVTDPEPLPDSHPLWSAKNLIITPHIGGDSTAFEPRAKKMVELQLSRIAQGVGPINQVHGPGFNAKK
jgi:phosphoglycerate dehydrogenase-like enzyme